MKENLKKKTKLKDSRMFKMDEETMMIWDYLLQNDYNISAVIRAKLKEFYEEVKEKENE